MMDMLTGERQTAIVRSKYVHVLLNQDMSFFGTYGNNGDIVNQVLGDMLIIQSTISEKVGNYIHNMATFFGGLIIGFINCWRISLITLAVCPFIIVVGGILNIFLQKLAENIQDAYAEAASIAEQDWIGKTIPAKKTVAIVGRTGSGNKRKLKNHPAIRTLLESGTVLQYGARTLNEGGFQFNADDVMFIAEKTGKRYSFRNWFLSKARRFHEGK